MTCWRGLVVTGAALLFSVAGIAAAADEPVLSTAIPSLPPGFVGTSSRFQVAGSDPLAGQDLLRWADEFAGRLENLLQAKIPATSDTMRLYHGVQTNVPDGRITVEVQPVERGLRIYRIRFVNGAAIEPEAAEGTLCRVLLDCWLAGAGAYAVASNTPAGEDTLCPIPRWFIDGLLQNLTSERRARNSEWMLDAWESGAVVPLRQFLSRDARWGPGTTNMLDPLPMRAQAGLLVAWLVSLPETGTRAEAIRIRLAKRQPLSVDWLAETAWGLKDVAAFEDAWDRWILKQKRMVFRPGVPTRRAVAELRAELAVVPGRQAVPRDADLPGSAGLAVLADHRRADWLDSFVRNKVPQLRLLAVGRGPAFNSVVDRYVLYLEALDGWSSRSRLLRLLEEANRALDDLEQQAGVPPPEPAESH